MSAALRWGLALVIAAGLSLHGRRKKSLDRGGALAAFAVGLAAFGASYRIGTQVIAFYGLSSWFTRMGTDRKHALEDDHREGACAEATRSRTRLMPLLAPGGQRTFTQVLSNSAIASLCALLYVACAGADDVAVGAHGEPAATAIFCAIVGHVRPPLPCLRGPLPTNVILPLPCRAAGLAQALRVLRGRHVVVGARDPREFQAPPGHSAVADGAARHQRRRHLDGPRRERVGRAGAGRGRPGPRALLHAGATDLPGASRCTGTSAAHARPHLPSIHAA